MNGNLRVILAFSLLFGASGCALGLNLNANRFDSPETRGARFKAHLEPFTLGGSNTLFVVPDTTANPIQINTPAWDRSNLSYRLSGGMGLFEALDVDLKLPWNAPALVQLKYQLWGDHELQARPGNLALALTLGAGFSQPSGDATNSINGVTGKYDLQFTTYDLALIAGGRLTETLLLYGGPFVTSVSYSGKVTQSGAMSGTFPLNGNATQSGANLGIQLDSVLASIKLEEAWAIASASGNGKAGFYTGLSLSCRF